jgi:Tfp pilus assembly protein PilO
MALFDTPRNKSVVVILIAAIIGYMFYSGDGIGALGFKGLRARQERVQALGDSIAALQAQTDSVKRDLAKSSIEDLKKRIEAYRGSLASLRQLVPDANEVPGLIDAITTRGKVRGVYVASIQPQPVENGPAPFDTYRYRMTVIGHYDQIGEFLTDVSGLRRIIVPVDVALVAANPTSARALGDTSHSILEARFTVKTFVKAPGGEGGAREK